MKFIFIIFYCIALISCTSSNEINESTFNPEDFETTNKELVRTFKNDYSLWTNEKDIEFYEDLRFNLGIFATFESMRESQYRKKGVVTDLLEIEKIIDSGKLTFLEGWSETCVYCKMGEIDLKNLKKDHSGNVNFLIVDVANRYLEDASETIKKYQIVSTPTYIIFDKNGDEIYRSVGYAAQGDKLSQILYENY
jgi:thiol-disulfide isomerase/thioredoxin